MTTATPASAGSSAALQLQRDQARLKQDQSRLADAKVIAADRARIQADQKASGSTGTAPAPVAGRAAGAGRLDVHA
jgi:hypothetical protein